jgi:hypothetical protein
MVFGAGRLLQDDEEVMLDASLSTCSPYSFCLTWYALNFRSTGSASSREHSAQSDAGVKGCQNFLETQLVYEVQ